MVFENPALPGAARAGGLCNPRACYALQRYTWYDFSMTRQPYPSDVSDAERAFVASTGSGAALPP